VHLSKIEMIGFKSFAEKTVVDLESGITAVVGPNGCGKTNICDAIRWVLGEENVRLLRGTRAEDVIFAGTDLRKPVGFAEVSLTVSDVRDALPVEYSEVTVTRRAFRSGDSEFLINNVPVRLKDIVDLFLGTGLGRRAYSVMERDMVDWILEDTSGQRRRIIEEAAGVSKYKARRRETQGKLDLTQRDLERVNDLIGEVQRRVGQLARQAAKARRYERLAARIQQVETYAAAKEFEAMAARRTEVGKELEAIETRLAEKASQMSVLEVQIEQARLAVLEVDKEANDLGAKIAEVTASAQKLETDKGVLAERGRSIDEKLAEITLERAEKQAALKLRQDLVEAKTAELAETRARLESLTKTYQELQGEHQRLDAELRARREETTATAQKRLDGMKRAIDVASSLTEARTRRNHAGEALEKAQSKREWITNRIGELRGEIDRTDGEIGNIKAGLAGDGARLEELSRVITDVTGKIELIRAELQRLAEEGARASSRHDVLKELVERYEGYETGVRALMQGERGRRGVHGVVGDIVRCTEPRYEPALAAALYNSLQYVVVESKDNAFDSVRMLKEEKKGPATLLLMDSIPGGDPAPGEGRGGGRGDARGDAPTGEGVIGPVTGFVDCEPRYRGVVDYLLRDVYVVESLDRAFALTRQAGGVRDFVTPDGDAVLRGNIVRAGQNGGSTDALIGRREKLAQLGERVEVLRNLSAEQTRAFEELKKSHEDLSREHASRKTAYEDSLRPLAEREKVLESKRLERESLERSLAELDGEIQGVRAALEAAEADSARLSEEHASLPKEQGDLFQGKAASDGLEREVDGLQKRLEETNVEMLKLEAAGGFIEQTLARVNGEAQVFGGDLTGLDERERDLNEKKRQIGEDHARLVGRVGALLEVLGNLEGRRNEVVGRKHDLETSVEDARHRVKAILAEKDEQMSAKQALQSELNLIGVTGDALKRRMRDEFDVDLEAIDLASFEPVENSEEELKTLRSHLRALGPVNLVALEEFDTEKERYIFLKTQRDDLVKARESLDEAIVQINKRARSEFAETFEKVRKDFRKNFQKLFQGGDADLKLQDENDPLESPVEILAQPTGKKLENIALLSGGERALTALAFLFAVYYTKPSPFCLLDEVDAPLDDSNVNRFVDLLKEFSTMTQFLMVTHNKKTMESASCLYGVTMQEPGVSRIVSVRLNHGDREAGSAGAGGAAGASAN
jgi:chromosome segregation protein